MNFNDMQLKDSTGVALAGMLGRNSSLQVVTTAQCRFGRESQAALVEAMRYNRTCTQFIMDESPWESNYLREFQASVQRNRRNESIWDREEFEQDTSIEAVCYYFSKSMTLVAANDSTVQKLSISPNDLDVSKFERRNISSMLLNTAEMALLCNSLKGNTRITSLTLHGQISIWIVRTCWQIC
jgi:hypothetical protein